MEFCFPVVTMCVVCVCVCEGGVGVKDRVGGGDRLLHSRCTVIVIVIAARQAV